MAVILFTMRDIEKIYAEFASDNPFAPYTPPKTRSGTKVLTTTPPPPPNFTNPFTNEKQVGIPTRGTVTKPTRVRGAAPVLIDPFASSAKRGVVADVKQAARDAPTFLRKTRRGGIAIVKKGLRKSKKLISRIASPGVKAGTGNISTGLRQIGGDIAVTSRRAGRGVLSHLGANKGKYALAGAALAAGAGYLATRPKEQQYSRYSRRPTSIYFSRR